MRLLGAETALGRSCVSGGLNAVGSTSWKDSKLEPPALLEPAAAAKVRNVAGATPMGTGSK